jgi:cysteine-rich repeat protein
MRFALLLPFCLLFTGCPEPLPDDRDGGGDLPEPGDPDAGSPADGGTDGGGAPSEDAGAQDAGAQDAGAQDAGTQDAGYDGGAHDAGEQDASYDAGEQDAGFDAGAQDAGYDAGAQDAGYDAGPPKADAGPLSDGGPPDAGPPTDAGFCGAECTCAAVTPDDFPLFLDTTGQGNDFGATGCRGEAEDAVVYFTAPSAGDYTFNTFGSEIRDTVLRVLDDSCGQNEVACNDDALSLLESKLTVTLSAGETIGVVVDGFTSSDVGVIRLNLGESNSERDCAVYGDCNTQCPADPPLTFVDFPRTFDNGGAANDWNLSLCSSNPTPDSAFLFTATDPGSYHFVTDQSSAPAAFSALAGSCGQWTERACDGDDGDGPPARFSIELEAGEQLPIVVETPWPEEFGEVNVDVQFVPDSCSKSILFLGNSYTSSNNLPHHVAQMGRAMGCAVQTDSSTPGGARFEDHLVNTTSLEKIASREWDVVVLQNQSQVPGWKPADVTADSRPNAGALVDLIKQSSPDARIVYFATWGRRDGDAQNCAYYPLVCTFDGHTQALQTGYEIYETWTGDTIASVGLAWKAVVDDPDAPFDPSTLWSGDDSHPTLKGTYLAAAVLYQSIFGTSATGNGHDYLGDGVGLSIPQAWYLQGIAARRAPRCRDNEVDANEQCDDGNADAGDFCDPWCRWEPADAAEPDDTFAEANDLTVGTVVTGHTIVGEDDVDWYAFDATVGATYVLRTHTVAGDCNGPLESDTILSLYDTDGVTRLARNDDFSGLCSMIVWEPPASGRYYIAASSWRSYGDYELEVTSHQNDIYEDNDDAANATPLGALPVSLSGLVDLRDEDWFAFDAIQGTDYSASITDSDCKSGDESALRLTALRADGTTQIVFDHEFETEECASISFSAPATELVYLQVRQHNKPLLGETYGLSVTSP